jgi:aminoglycoside phosphotransferase (APT) family kinase protein
VRQNSFVLELDEKAAPAYVAERLGIDIGKITATSLGGGISNHVVLIETPEQRFVLKQSLPKLRVEEDWFSDRERIFRESSSLRKLSPLLPAGTLPEIVFEDRDQFAYAMTAAPARAETWKAKLMNGIVDLANAEEVARIQAFIMRVSWQSPEWEGEFGDQTAFEQLRLNPYYEVTADRHPELGPYFARAIERCRTHRCCLVHGDWSPKNMMVDGGTVMAIDFEVIHYGDPSFDCAFLLNHLLLKSFHRPQWAALYRRAAESYWHTLVQAVPEDTGWLETATLEQVPLLLLARVDGKSPAEYIREPGLRTHIRQFAVDLLAKPALEVREVFKRLSQRLK